MTIMYARRVLAPFAFLAAFTISISVFMETVGWIVTHEKQIDFTNFSRIRISSWGEHNIIFIFGMVISTSLASFLCGAVCKTKMNVNIALVCSSAISLISAAIYFKSPEIEFAYQFKSFPLSSLIALVISNLSAYEAFNEGISAQKKFSDETILGVKEIHWFWILIPFIFGPAYFWGVGFLYALLLALQFMTDGTIFLYLIAIIPVFIWGFIPYRIYNILSYRTYEKNSKLFRFISVLTTYVVGCLLAMLSQIPCYWIIGKII